MKVFLLDIYDIPILLSQLLVDGFFHSSPTNSEFPNLWEICRVISLNLSHNLINLSSELRLPGYDLCNLCIEFFDINYFFGILLLDIATHCDIIVIVCYRCIIDQCTKILDILTITVSGQNFLSILLCEGIFGVSSDKFSRCIDKEGFVVGFIFFEYNNTSSDRCPKK